MASAGPNFPSVGANDATVGTVAWSGTANIFATDGVGATANLPAGATSEYLVGTGFGFSIPAGATVLGVSFSVVARATGGTQPTESSIKLVKAGVVSGTEHAANASVPTSYTAHSFGSSSDLWGLTLTATDVNASNFGVAYSAKANNIFSSVSTVDSFTLTVTYTLTVPLATCAATSTASATVTIPANVPTATSAGTSTAAASFTAPTTLSLATCAATSSTSTIAVFNPPFSPANGSSTAGMGVTAPTAVPLAASAGTSTGAVTIGFNGLVPLAASAGTSTTGADLALVVSFFLQLAPCNAQSAGILLPSAKQRAYLNRSATRVPPQDKEPNRAGWQPKRVGERAQRAWSSKF